MSRTKSTQQSVHEEGEAGRDGGNRDDAGASFLRSLWEQIGTLVLAVVIALAIRAFVIEPFRIPSGSMLPTLLIGDHLFVNKFIYGPRIPFTDVRLPGLRDPRRGDVVVFEVARGDGRRVPLIVPADKHPELRREDFVKRIVGLPGDRIAVENGRVTINGDVLPLAATEGVHIDEVGRQLPIKIENLEGCGHPVLDDPHYRGLEKPSFVVPEGRYFMMGDNRDYSNDSRNWGTVRPEEFKGPAFMLYWSWNVNGSALQFFNPVNWWTAEKRWNRIFQRIRCDDLSRAGTAAGD